MENLTSIVKFPKYLFQFREKWIHLIPKLKCQKTLRLIDWQRKSRNQSSPDIRLSVSFYDNPYSTDFKFNLPTLKYDNRCYLHIVDHFGFSPPDYNHFSKMQRTYSIVSLNPLTDTSPVLSFETRKISFRNDDDFGLKECSIVAYSEQKRKLRNLK